MTANISQHVIPRHRQSASVDAGSLPYYRVSSARLQPGLYWQQGTINPTAVTVALGLISIIAIATLSFVYLGQVLTTASQGTDIQNLENKITNLRQRQQELELEGAELRSIQAIEQQIQQLNLTVADKVTYLNLPSGKVATAN